MPDGSEFRDSIYNKYDFTPGARQALVNIVVEIQDLNSTSGGGGWFPDQRRILLNGVQDEACIHELSHAWADETGFYTDPHPEDRRRNARNFAFRDSVEHAANETDPAFRRVSFLCWEYTYGNPTTGFPGMGEADWERFAGLASGVMADIRLMPPGLRHWYEPLFGGDPLVTGPSELPGWAPRGWVQGQPPPVHSLGSTSRWERLTRRIQEFFRTSS